MRRIDLTNKRFSRLTVVAFAGKSKNGNAMWLCHCDCGKEVTVDGYLLRNGNTKSCGCLRRERGREAMETNSALLANRSRLENLKQVEGTSLLSLEHNRKNNRSGVAGVTFDRRSKHWVARLMVRGKYVLNKTFPDFEEAAQARQQAVDEYLKPIRERRMRVEA